MIDKDKQADVAAVAQDMLTRHGGAALQTVERWCALTLAAGDTASAALWQQVRDELRQRTSG